MTEEVVEFRIIDSRVLSFSYIDTQGIKIEKGQEFEVKLGINYRWSFEENKFGVVLDFIFIDKVEKTKRHLLKAKILTEYEVKDLSEHFIVRGKKDFDMNTNIEVTLVSIAISTSRGILMEKTNGTVYRNLIVPIVNPNDLILSPKMNGDDDCEQKQE